MASSPTSLFPSFLHTTALAAGMTSHVLYFNRGEHHLHGVKYISLLFMLSITFLGVSVRYLDVPFKEALSSIVFLSCSFLAGLYASLLLYRVFFHPLKNFPGPFPARLTSLWYSTQCTNADSHKQVFKLHEKYGEFLRVGSSDLSIAHPEAVEIIYGHGTRCTKSPWYDQTLPLVSMHTARSRALHDRRRRIWSVAFSDKALRGYETRIRGYGERLKKQLASLNGNSVNASKWFNYYSFDVMGDLAFGESFDMLRNGKEHWAIKIISEAMDSQHLMMPPWVFRIFLAIPGLSREFWKGINYCNEQLAKRMNRKVAIPDIMSALLEPYRNHENNREKDLHMLQADSQLIIVAGSDTIAATMTHLFFYLAEDQTRLENLRVELLPYVTQTGDVNYRDIQDAPYLNGCINEALRLNPPVPSAIQRLTPPEGVHIGGTYVPGNMTVWAPQYVLNRREDLYPQANKFIPERWFTGQESVRNKHAFAPFSAGPYGCIGRPLALMQIRTVTAKLISTFDISLAPGEDGSKLLNRSRDHFTMGLNDLNLTFTTNQRGNLATLENLN